MNKRREQRNIMKTIGTPPHIHDHLVIVEGEEQQSERQLLKMKVRLVGKVEDGGWFNTEGPSRTQGRLKISSESGKKVHILRLQ
jgi:hypothetical protein